MREIHSIIRKHTTNPLNKYIAELHTSRLGLTIFGIHRGTFVYVILGLNSGCRLVLEVR